MPLKPAKSEALRTFVVLDSEAVLSGLSALDGGAVDEILTRTTDDNASQIGGHVGGRAAKAQAGKNRGRKVEEELRRRRTEHSAAATLIDRLSDMEAVGEVEGSLDEDVAAALTPGDAILVRGEVLLHPLHQVDVMLRSFIDAAPSFDEQATAKELRKALPMWEAMVGSGKAARILFDLATGVPQVPRTLVPVKRSALQVEVADVPGFSTLLAKVDRIVGPEEYVLAVRVLQNAPVSELERSAVEEAAVDMVEGFSELGVACTREDLVMQGPVVVLRPLCIWR
ncbi:MAG: hypothetical protein LC808_35725 [Actinobacteria bacterium]|nr:hypothetical protein [Actinomycetota bacterium]